VQGAFATVVWVVAWVGVLVALIAALTSRKTWNEYGRHHLVLDTDTSRAKPSSASERDDEIRQLLEERNAGARRGEPEGRHRAELARLTEPQTTPSCARRPRSGIAQTTAEPDGASRRSTSRPRSPGRSRACGGSEPSREAAGLDCARSSH
jgi:hypothetical protein